MHKGDNCDILPAITKPICTADICNMSLDTVLPTAPEHLSLEFMDQRSPSLTQCTIWLHSYYAMASLEECEDFKTLVHMAFI
ncbi:hypothetical protein J6590_094315 [Homalodisca vitripennis]|nr:hypothetical protein J6590_094315 [Homalodisca vitripennis]